MTTKNPTKGISEERRRELVQHGMDTAAAERAAQGLPPHIEDPVTLQKLAVLFNQPKRDKGVA